jgi:hypothetical protein
MLVIVIYKIDINQTLINYDAFIVEYIINSLLYKLKKSFKRSSFNLFISNHIP